MTNPAVLPDVNVLIALIDPNHVHHDAAHDWFGALGQATWATCPLTENGVIRIVGHARYPNSAGSPGQVAGLLTALCAHERHIFWPDDISWRDADRLDHQHLLHAGQVTDGYLLALAAARGARLVTFDRRLVAMAVTGGAKALHVL